MKSYLLGVDLGTTNVKAAIFDLEGNSVSTGQSGRYTIVTKYKNWAEQDANLWWTDTVDAIRQALGNFFGDCSEIAGVSVSSQGMAMLPLDRNKSPLCLAHIWMDRRAVEEAKIIEEEFGRDRVKECFGAYSDPYYQVTNILWFKRHQPELYAKTRYIVKANTYLNYMLTGEIAIDEGQAAMTLCYDIHKRAWSDELGKVLDIPFREIMPRVGQANDILGQVTKEAAVVTGLAFGTPVMIGGVDSALALLEVGITEQGDAAEITGTSSNNFFASMQLPPKESPLLSFMPLVSTNAVPHLLFGPTNTTGEAVRWFRKIMKLQNDTGPDGEPIYQFLENLVESSEAGCRGLFFYPYLMGERAPLWDNDVRGMYIGAMVRTTQGEMLRSIYEGTSFALKEICLEAEKTGIEIKRFRVAGGCAKSDIWLRIKASVLNSTIKATINSGGAPKGNAILAGYGVGIYRDFNNTVNKMLHFDKTIEPIPEWVKIYDEMYYLFIKMRNHLRDDLAEAAKLFSKYGA